MTVRSFCRYKLHIAKKAKKVNLADLRRTAVAAAAGGAAAGSVLAAALWPALGGDAVNALVRTTLVLNVVLPCVATFGDDDEAEAEGYEDGGFGTNGLTPYAFPPEITVCPPSPAREEEADPRARDLGEDEIAVLSSETVVADEADPDDDDVDNDDDGGDDDGDDGDPASPGGRHHPLVLHVIHSAIEMVVFGLSAAGNDRPLAPAHHLPWLYSFGLSYYVWMAAAGALAAHDRLRRAVLARLARAARRLLCCRLCHALPDLLNTLSSWMCLKDWVEFEGEGEDFIASSRAAKKDIILV